MSGVEKTALSRRRITRNFIWNFTGLSAPMLVALFAIPSLIDVLGKERFGLLAIIWVGIGYFSLFDMGIGRALTKLMAEGETGRSSRGQAELIWTALFLMLGLGLIGCVAIWWGSQSLVSEVLNVQGDLTKETVTAFRVLAVGLPFVVVTAAFIGILEVHQRFAAIATVRIPMGIMTFAAPLATAQFTPDLAWATAALLAVRVTALVVYFFVAANGSPELKKFRWIDTEKVRPLLTFGGWLTVTNIIGPLMVYFDRFFIGTLMTMASVAYYVTPYEVISRLQLLPQSIVGVLFPALAATHRNESAHLSRLYGHGNKVLLLIMLPVMLMLYLLAPEGLSLWLGEDFRNNSTPVVYWLTLGFLVNSVGVMPLTVLQSTGRPDLVAKAHMFELIPYGLALWFLTTRFGIAGTAFAWFLRALLDTVLLNGITIAKLPVLKNSVTRMLFLTLLLPLAWLLLWYIEPLWQRLALGLFVSVFCGTALLVVLRKDMIGEQRGP